jgi:hypothetical protein
VFAARAGCYVAVGQHAGQRLWRGLELQAQDVGESAFFRFDDGAGVVCDQPAQHGVGVLGVAQVPGAVEGVQARVGKARRIADVVQPCGGFQQIGVSAENRRQAARPRGDTLDVCPAAGEGFAGGVPGRAVRPRKLACSCGKARQPRRDVHGRGMPSEDVLFSVGSRYPVAVLASAGRTSRHQEFCGASAASPGSQWG